jgi:hypothetical protein
MRVTVMPMIPRQLRTVLRDYRDAWTSTSGDAAKQARRRVGTRLYGVPTVASLPFLFWHLHIPSFTPYLTALSVFTALLFGLLFLVFNFAVTVRKDGKAFSNAHGLLEVISDLRATITYTIFVAVALVVVLAVAAGAVAPSTQPAPALLVGLTWLWTPPVVWLAVHLALNIFKILERFRTAFNLISR